MQDKHYLSEALQYFACILAFPPANYIPQSQVQSGINLIQINVLEVCESWLIELMEGKFTPLTDPCLNQCV